MSLKIRGFLSFAIISVSSAVCAGQSPDFGDIPPLAEPAVIRPLDPIIPVAPILPSMLPTGPLEPTAGVDWNALLRESFAFLSLEHGFRYLTEKGTRHPGLGFARGYAESVGNLHGWGDGDPFLVNYIGHPMQGAVTGFLFTQNDRKYRYAEFGKNAWYWKSRLRAAAFSWVYSEQFEIGILSEASIGHTQAFFPQQGFVDHVATPAIGLGWMVVEDALDKYVISSVDRKVRNGVVRALVRGGLNPTRSMANAMSFDTPWHRNARMDPWEPPRPTLVQVTPKRIYGETESHPLIAPFEFTVNARVLQSVGSQARGACVGGGASAAYRVSPNWQIVGDVGGCNLTHFADNYSGDSLTYMAGPRWTGNPEKQWEPFAQVLVGGRTLTHEKIDPDKKAALEAIAAKTGVPLSYPDHDRYATQTEVTGLAVAASAGVDLKLHPAIALRVVDLGFMHSWNSRLDGINYGSTMQLSTGLILRFGTW